MKRRYRRFLTAIGIAGAILLVGAVAGILYLRTTDWWITVTLFSDDTRVDNFKQFHTLFPAEQVQTGTDVWTFQRDPRALPEVIEVDGEPLKLSDFLDETWTTGLAIAVDDTLVVDEYFRGYDDESLPTSFSMAKSVVSALVGIAIDQGYITSVTDRVDQYLPAFEGTDYGAISLHDLLTMSSGMAFDEDYDSFTSDINMLPVRVFGFQDPLPELVVDTEAVREPGTYNEYASSDTIILGLVLEAAVDATMSQFLQEELWIPAGMESPAYWNTDYHGNTLGHAFFSASLRDYLRFARLYLNQGLRDEHHIIPAPWVETSVNPEEAHLQPGDNPDSFWTFGYGYQWWIPEEPQGDFVAIGIWGQYMYVHPEHNVVIAKTSADYHFDDRDHETIAVFRALARWAASHP